jgi:rubrerythrin
MSSLGQFSAEKTYDMAILTERNGRVFYEAAAAAATTERVAKLMHHLAEAERSHEATFRRMREVSPQHPPRETYAGEEEEYMGALLFSRVLPDEAAGTRAVAAMRADAEALDFAIAFEKDTILFLYEMRDIVSADEAAKVNALLAQEKSHVRILTGLKQELARAD